MNGAVMAWGKKQPAAATRKNTFFAVFKKG
jgi:hypothetical protein